MATAELQEPQIEELDPTPEDPLYEIINGHRVEMPPMGVTANLVNSRLHILLGHHTELHDLGTILVESLFIIDRQRKIYRRPDVAFVTRERWPLDRPLPPTGDWEIVPDLAVEVISPNEKFHQVVRKVREFFGYGIQQVWLVEPLERLVFLFEALNRVTVLQEHQTLEGGTLIPGFQLPLSKLFRGLPPAPELPSDE